MALNAEQATLMVDQLQNAHRISVAFYSRILPLLDGLANELNLGFWYWSPIETARPSRRGTAPSSNWAWDFVPLFASEHCYRNEWAEKASPNDIGIAFELYIDNNFSSARRSQLNIKGQPDPLSLQQGAALLRASVFRPLESSDSAFSDLWDSTGSAEVGTEMKNLNEQVKGVCYEWPLAEVLIQQNCVTETLAPHCSIKNES